MAMDGVSSEGFERKLAAILYTDVAGYSRLTGSDEVGTHRRLSEYLDLIADQIKQRTGGPLCRRRGAGRFRYGHLSHHLRGFDPGGSRNSQ